MVTESVVFGAEDASRLLALTQSIGWGHTLADWRTALGAGAVFGHRDAAGDAVASAAIFPYGTALASIGFVIVRADHRGRGLARALMRRCLEHFSPAPPTILVATADGFPLYRALGFDTIEDVHRLTSGGGVPPDAEPEGLRVAPIDESDREAIGRLDAEVYGVDRARLLTLRLAQRSAGLGLRARGGQLVGFALAALQGDRQAVGPVVAPDTRGAAALIQRLARAHPGVTVVHVPGRHQSLIDALAGGGFEPHGVQPLMLLRASALPGHRDRLFAVTTLAFG